MCDPVSISIGLMVAGGTYSAANSIQQGNQQNKYYQYLAGQSIKQGELAIQTGEQNSKFAQEAGSKDTEAVKRNAAQTAGDQRATLASMGVSGVTAEDIALDTYDQSKLDEVNVRYNSDVRSWEEMNAARVEKWNLENQAEEYKYAGKMAKRAGKLGAFGTLLGTATSVASVGGFQKKPVTPGQGGYGINTPPGTINEGTWSRLPKRGKRV